jgi:tRNA threonylcarbamoyladenosine biosynthesis protein TsaB
MTILGVDSATSTASAALVEDGKIIAEQAYSNRSDESDSQAKAVKVGHAEVLIPLIASVLEQTQRAFVDLHGIAVSIGPGSFTGLRIGLSTVKGLAYGWNIPVAGVSTLAANAARVTDTEGLICSLLDARKQQVYAALFRRSGGSLTRMTEDAVVSVEAAVEYAFEAAAGGACLFIGDGAAKYGEVLSNVFGNDKRYSQGSSYPCLAAAAARLAEPRLRLSGGDFLGALVPVYLRPAEAESKRRESL